MVMRCSKLRLNANHPTSAERQSKILTCRLTRSPKFAPSKTLALLSQVTAYGEFLRLMEPPRFVS